MTFFDDRIHHRMRDTQWVFDLLGVPCLGEPAIFLMAEKNFRIGFADLQDMARNGLWSEYYRIRPLGDLSQEQEIGRLEWLRVLMSHHWGRRFQEVDDLPA